MHLDHQLSAEQAAAIASSHGLGLDDAIALRILADDADEAERIAAIFEHQGDAA